MVLRFLLISSFVYFLEKVLSITFVEWQVLGCELTCADKGFGLLQSNCEIILFSILHDFRLLYIIIYF